MPYLRANLRNANRATLRDIYLTDVVKNINDSIANAFTGTIMRKRYADLLHPEKEETRTAEEIIEHISNKLEQLGA